MHRPIVYPSAIPQDTDLLLTNKHTMIALGYLMQAVLGTGTFVDGMACTPTSPAGMTVNVGGGSIYALAQIDATAYGSLAADTADQVVKQGLVIATQNFSCPAPAASGQSVVYLIEAAFQEVDGGPTVLPYYNASNPTVPYSGPNNSGTPNYTVRQGLCTVQVKTGVAAATGSQATPSPDAGFTGLYAITVANGQTTITSGNIAQIPTAPFIGPKLTAVIGAVQAGSASFAHDTSVTANTIAVALSPVPAQLTDGMRVFVKVANTCTGTTVMNANALGNVPVVTKEGNSMSPGSLQANGIYLLAYDGNGTRWQVQNPSLPNGASFGQCLFQYTSPTVCTLLPKNGNLVSFPSGAIATIGPGGIASTITAAYVNGTAAQPLSASTLYYAYLWNSGSGYVIDWSTTAYSVENTTGIVVKSGDATRVLVGMAYPMAGPVFNYSNSVKLVRSWFNDVGISIVNQFSVSRSTGSTTAVELSSEIRATCLLWSNESASVNIAGVAANNSAGHYANTSVGFNSTTISQEGNTAGTSASANAFFPASASVDLEGLSEGFNYFTLLGFVDAGVATWQGSATSLGINTRRTI